MSTVNRIGIPAGFDFLNEVEPELVADADLYKRFLEDASCAGDANALRDESGARDARFAKRLGAAESKPLAKSAADSEWADAVQRSKRMIRKGNLIELYDADGELLAQREVNE
jgi:hypothetical protein